MVSSVTAQQIQQLMVAEVGDFNPPVLAPNITLIWNRWTAKAAIFPWLQELYSKRDLIDLAMAQLRNQVDYSIDGAIRLQLKERTDYLKDRRKETCEEITKWEGVAQANRSGAIAPLVNTELETPPTTGIPNPPPYDQNSPVFRGSPYWQDQGTGPTP